ncbi:MAG TPA: glycosyltransferase family 2 protein [Armatimonadota bacterium]|nr:glycosyltransferase family 2 protein [Armatimonadota bacterium]
MEAQLQHVIVLIPAYMEETRIADTVHASWHLPGVTRVVVVDDGSNDATADVAAQAGAEVIRLQQNSGKGAALRAGLDACPGSDDDVFLLLDADLGATASEAGKLLPPVLHGEADLTIARFPKVAGKAGFGLVKGLARWGTWLLTHNRLDAPISGQRACRRWVLTAAPIADGYGVEVAMNIAAGDARARVLEIPVQMSHNATGRNLRGFQHRGKQFVHIFGALLAALFGNTGSSLLGRVRPGRVCVWGCALCASSAFLFYRAQPVSPFTRPVTLLLAYLAAIIGLLAAAIISGYLCSRKRNFRQRFIPALGGIALIPVSLLALHGEREHVFRLFSPTSGWLQREFTVLVIISLFCWTVLGLLDDVKGNADSKGFRGHITALMHGKLTTGGMKLLGGGVLSLLTAGMIIVQRAQPVGLIPVTALLIALSANAMNLFDLRPGRALKIFWLVSTPVLFVLPPDSLQLLMLIVLLASVLYAPFDFAGMMMLGDTGANPLGALLGIGLALALPWYGQCLAVLLLLALHVYAERVSITRTIERVNWLRWLDRLGRDITQ